MAKITKLEQKTFNNKPSGFTITFDDGRSGNLLEKESEKGIREGDDVFVTEVPYTSKAGKTSTLYEVHRTNGGKAPAPASQPQQGNTPTPPPRPSINVGAGKSKEEMKAEASTKVLLKILDVFYEGKLQSAQVSVELKDFGRLIWSEIDEIYSQK